MERVSILEASRRLNLTQATIRQYIRDGKLKAQREDGTGNRAWLVELPEDGWMDQQKESFQQMAQQMSPWWWANGERSGHVHYVEDLGIEEILAQFLCGFASENIWPADGHRDEERCPECRQTALDRGLSLTSSQ